MRLVRSSLILSSVLAALMMMAVPEALTQEQPATPPTPKLSQVRLEAFADAANEVQRLEAELNARMQTMDSPEKAVEARQEAQAQATRAVESRGLTTSEYMAIVHAAERDPSLYAMITDMMQQRAQ